MIDNTVNISDKFFIIETLEKTQFLISLIDKELESYIGYTLEIKYLMALITEEYSLEYKMEKPEILQSISSSGKLEEDSEKLLVETIKELKKNFNS